jgi:hypothetical protein
VKDSKKMDKRKERFCVEGRRDGRMKWLSRRLEAGEGARSAWHVMNRAANLRLQYSNAHRLNLKISSDSQHGFLQLMAN